MKPLIFLFLLMALSACISSEKVKTPPVNLQKISKGLTQTDHYYYGILPCPNCPGVQYRLNLFSDKTFYIQTHYQKTKEPHTFYDIGRWDFSSDYQYITLKGGREAPEVFKIEDANTLIKVNPDNREVNTDAKLTRMAKFHRLNPKLMINGMYQYMADAALFTNCLTGKKWPVALTQNHLEVEREYLKIRQQPGEKIMLLLEGQISMEPAMEGNKKVETLVVLDYGHFSPEESCRPLYVTEPLENTYWRLTRIYDQAVILQNQREPHLILSPDKHQAKGFGGCNRFFGSYQRKNDQLKFGKIASTLMACQQGGELERSFYQALNETTHWKILGHHLELFNDDNEIIARFEFRHFN